MAVGIGFVFCGITTGGSGGGGICAGFPEPFVVPFSYCCWPGAPANWGGGGRDIEEGCIISCLISAIGYRYKQSTSFEEVYKDGS